MRIPILNRMGLWLLCLFMGSFVLGHDNVNGT